MAARFHRAAVAELVAARDWYEHARAGLGDSFVTEVERVVDLVDQFPSRFAFSIFFEEIDAIRYVWAVFHHRRDPQTIGRRRSS